MRKLQSVSYETENLAGQPGRLEADEIKPHLWNVRLFDGEPYEEELLDWMDRVVGDETAVILKSEAQFDIDVLEGTREGS